ncbi:hypothetical protein [Rhodoblastus sp.]|uniref:hypothetical protein n=1 Tax=Rhodoblastus sp. TaxID=1962975 RepID=UPI003F9B75F6
MADSNVSISFGADASDFLEGVARVSAALQTLPTGVNQIAQGIDKSSQSFASFGVGATSALAKIAAAARETGASQQDVTRASMMAINGEISAERAALAEKKSLYDELTKLKILSAGERLAATQAALDGEYASERSLLEKELQLDGLKLQQRQMVLNKMLMLDAKYAQDSQRVMLQSVEQMVAPMNKMVDSMSSSLSTGLTGMITGTKNFQQVLQSLAQSVVSQFVKMGVDVVADWAKKQLALAALSVAGESQKTAAATVGAAAREGVSAGEAAAGQASIVVSMLKSITASASETFAGVFGFLAPVMGPAAAGPAAAAQGAVMSVAAFDIGAWSIPQDQLAMVHRNELVMPAAEAGAFRSLLSQQASVGAGAGAQSGGDTHVHLNVNALDAGSVKNWLGNNSRQIMKAMNQAVKNGDHLGLRRLATS